MKPLLKIILILITFFTSTLLIIKFTGVLNVTQIKDWLIAAQDLSPFYVGSLVALLLFADLFIAMPTLTVTILAGFFLGHLYGSIAALIGLISAGSCGYALSYRYGDKVFNFLLEKKTQREEAIASFQQHSVMMILLSRAMPMLPEICACLAGASKMGYMKFICCWLLSAIPYVLVATYAGSISSIDNPTPALYTAIGISALLWIAWFVYHRYYMRTKALTP
ncbi:MAG: VTT domain-containing protein [Oceanospirillaceae bacterium]|nr:VTT domain-containing protein [Oceanospirillaceae bacterium]